MKEIKVKRRHFLIFNTLLAGIILLMSACATPKIRPIDKKDVSDNIRFIVNDSTTREEILLNLGEPSGRFENDRILTYILTINDDRKLRVIPRALAVNHADPRVYALNPMACSLVIVFQNDNIVQKSGLICSMDELK